MVTEQDGTIEKMIWCAERLAHSPLIFGLVAGCIALWFVTRHWKI